MPPDAATAESPAAAAALYGPAYYASHCGPVPYERNDHWLRFFGDVADELVRAFAPRRAFDAGCALGMLVECLWDRGVEAYGRDISPFAIESVRADVAPFCTVGSIADPIEGEYDVLTCIEVLEHMPEQDALQAMAAMAAAAPRILFSSSPSDLSEPTHCNVRPTAYWLGRWAEHGFAPLSTHDAGYLAPHAYVLERSEQGRTPRELAAFADRVRYRVALAQLGGRVGEITASLSASEEGRARAEAAFATLEADRQSSVEAERVAAADTIAQLRAELDRRSLEDKRLRASAARRAADAREEAEQLRLQARLAPAAAANPILPVATQISPATSQLAGQAELERLRRDLRGMTAERDRLLNSTVWRASWPLRAAAHAMPGFMRGSARRALSAVWWTATGQLGPRLRTRRAVLADMRLLRASPLFDQGWYEGRYPDVGASGLDPALHYATIGGPEGRDPGPLFAASAYLLRHPGATKANRPALLHFLEAGGTDATAYRTLAAPHPAEQASRPVRAAPTARALPADTAQPVAGAPDGRASLDTLLSQRFNALEALRTYHAPHHAPRLTIVTDSINADSLYGGVGTSVVLAVLLAKRLGAGLRLVTRTKPADRIEEIGALLHVQGIAWNGSIEQCHAPPGPGGYDVPVSHQDVFLTTSWWTTWSTRRAVDPARIAYLLQEDERGFYPLGDDHLRCSETLSDPALLYIVNSQLLMDHLCQNHLAPGGVAFEPAFPPSSYRPESSEDSSRLNFFFYARPNNPRNLYWRGLEAVGGAIEEGVLDPDLWAFHFVGLGAHELVLPRGVRPQMIERLPWSDYAGLIRRMDLGLSLMDTPHPSYPPLDLAASGAVVVTNRFGLKQSLEAYSTNIVCAGTAVVDLVDGLRRGVALASDRALRNANFQGNGLERDWETSLAPALDALTARFQG